MEVLINHRLAGGKVFDDTQFLETTMGRVPLSSVKPGWFVFSEGFNSSRLYLTAKRLIEAAASAILLLLHLPLMVVIAMAIKLESPGGILFRQKRVGKDGRHFWIYKFRSMADRKEAPGEPTWTEAGDKRITRVGRIIRPLRLDELPQLLNVLRGDMHLVGPRPERPEFVELLSKEIPFYDKRHAVKPGITGWAQVNFPYGASVEDARLKLEYDLYYVKHMSLLLDWFIVVKTIKTVLRPEKGR